MWRDREKARQMHDDLVVPSGMADAAAFRLTLPLAQPPAKRRLRSPKLLVLPAPDVLLQALDERLQIGWRGRAFGAKQHGHALGVCAVREIR